jgi:hypothetical protein
VWLCSSRKVRIVPWADPFDREIGQNDPVGRFGMTKWLITVLLLAGCATDNPASAPSTSALGMPSVEPTAAPDDSTADAVASSPTPNGSLSPSATASTSQPTVAGSAMSALQLLAVKGRAPKTGYSREAFGPAWTDVDRNGCDTRNDILKRDLTGITMEGRCKVLTGTLKDPYSARTVFFVRGGASEVDIDHVVALSDAWQKGAQPWEFAKRVAFANDPLNLLATDASVNRAKSDSDSASWRPPDRSSWCAVAARQVAVKLKYELWVTSAERDALAQMLAPCPDQKLPDAGAQPTIASNVGVGPTAVEATPKGELDARYRTCAEAKANGLGPYTRGVHPEYDWYRDGDKDGIVCE